LVRSAEDAQRSETPHVPRARATTPGVAVSPEELCDAIRDAAHRARLDGDAGHGQTTDIRFGE
jgi:hypothetical protein